MDAVPSLPMTDLMVPGRVHEATGSGRRVLALGLAAAVSGPILWIQEGHVRDRLNPHGLAAFFDPGRVVLATPSGATTLLQVMEDALRSGAAALVIGELSRAPDLTQSRRLQLAAGTGGGRGLCLVPETGLCSNAAETRWRCQALPGRRGTAAQHWELLKNKRGRLGTWDVGWTGPARGFTPLPRSVEPDSPGQISA